MNQIEINKIERESIMKVIAEYHRKQGVAFLSEKDAADYFRGLVEIVEEFLVSQKQGIEHVVRVLIEEREGGVVGDKLEELLNYLK